MVRHPPIHNAIAWSTKRSAPQYDSANANNGGEKCNLLLLASSSRQCAALFLLFIQAAREVLPRSLCLSRTSVVNHHIILSSVVLSRGLWHCARHTRHHLLRILPPAVRSATCGWPVVRIGRFLSKWMCLLLVRQPVSRRAAIGLPGRRSLAGHFR